MEIEFKVLAGDCIARTAKNVKFTFDFVSHRTNVNTVYFVFNDVKVVCDKDSTVESLIESYITQINEGK